MILFTIIGVIAISLCVFAIFESYVDARVEKGAKRMLREMIDSQRKIKEQMIVHNTELDYLLRMHKRSPREEISQQDADLCYRIFKDSPIPRTKEEMEDLRKLSFQALTSHLRKLDGQPSKEDR